MSGRVIIGHGTLHNGNRTEASYSRSRRHHSAGGDRAEHLAQLSTCRMDGSTQLLNSRFILTPPPRMIFSSLVPLRNISAHSVTSSARLRWEYRPGQCLVLQRRPRNLLESQTPTGLLNRSVAVRSRACSGSDPGRAGLGTGAGVLRLV